MEITGYLTFEIIDDCPPPAEDWCFCLGLARSGSTAACELVSHHPHAVMLREAWLWGYVELLRSGSFVYREPAFPVDNQELVSCFDAGGIPASAVRAIMEGIRSAVGVAPVLVGDKKSRYLHFLEDIRTVFPSCKLFVCMRDEWDTVASFMDSGWWLSAHRELSRRQLAEKTLVSVRTAQATARGAIDKYNAFVVDFEDMAAQPEATLSRLLEYLGLDLGVYNYKTGLEGRHYGEAIGHWERVPEVVALRKRLEG